jgi:RNA polymerase-binding transcription factor DksA
MNSPPDDPHYHCEPGHECAGCGEHICPRCHGAQPTAELCADCYWTADPGSAA